MSFIKKKTALEDGCADLILEEFKELLPDSLNYFAALLFLAKVIVSL